MTDDLTLPDIGPVQLLVVGFQDPDFRGEILAQLRDLRERDLIRLVDLTVVSKNDAGEIAVIEMSDLTAGERAELGAVAGALIGVTLADAWIHPADLVAIGAASAA